MSKSKVTYENGIQNISPGFLQQAFSPRRAALPIHFLIPCTKVDFEKSLSTMVFFHVTHRVGGNAGLGS